MVDHSPPDLDRLEAAFANTNGRQSLLPMLHHAQATYGYLPKAVLARIGERLRVPLADIYGVVEFYSLFTTEPPGERVIRVCTDPVCALAGAESTLKEAQAAERDITVERMTCLGLCDHAPAALVDSLPVAPAADLLTATEPTSTLKVTGDPLVMLRDINRLPPTELAGRDFAALKHALSLPPEEVIGIVKDSGLVGRGGAAFPTGTKWQFTRAADGAPKYVVCNADESEPGTFKDRVLMEGDPFRVLEGMLISGYAVGAEEGYLFIRGEYPLAAGIMAEAVDALREAGLLGEDILGTGFTFDVTLRRGAGAYICGEETALFEAIEGKRGFPRVKPPFPTTHGLFGQPTAINNVETLAQVPDILVNGAEWFRQWGTEDSVGLKLFCLSGHIRQPGVVEAPFGITLRELIERHGGGFLGDPAAVLLGGAAGTFLTAEHLDTPLTYEDLRPLGASIGSGAVMVFNTGTDFRMVLRKLAHFFAHESCGKCYPCQIGTQRQMEILDKPADLSPDDLSRLRDIGQTMTDSSICGLGQTAALAVLSGLERLP